MHPLWTHVVITRCNSNPSGVVILTVASCYFVLKSSPGRCTGGHIRCYVKREVVSSGLGGRLHRFTLCQGAEYAADNGKFLLSAVQESKQRYALYLNRTSSGKPCARLAANVMRTTYQLQPERSAWMCRMLRNSGAWVQGATASSRCSNTPSPPPGSSSSSPSSLSSSPDAGVAGVCTEPLARITYKLRVRGMMLPRR
eukprot:jgi/Chrzof1/4668/Cz14g22050.t1